MMPVFGFKGSIEEKNHSNSRSQFLSLLTCETRRDIFTAIGNLPVSGYPAKCCFIVGSVRCIEFYSIKPAAVVLEPAFFGNCIRIKDSFPMIIGPSGRAKIAGHGD